MKPNIDIGHVFDKTIEVYKSNATQLIVGTLIYAFVAVLPLAILVLVAGIGSSLSGPSDGSDLEGGTLAAVIVGIIVFVVIQWIISMWLVELSVRVTASDYGREPKREFGELSKVSFKHVGTLILVSIVAGIAIGVGLVLILVPGLILLTIWSLIAPVIVLENKGAIDCLGRSWELVKGNGLVIFVTFFLIYLIVVVISVVLGLVPIVGNMVTAFLTPVPIIAATVIYMRTIGADAAQATTHAMPAPAPPPPVENYPPPTPGGPGGDPPVPPPPPPGG